MLEKTFVSYNKNSSTFALDRLKRAYKRAAKDADCAQTNLYKHIGTILRAMETVMSEFKSGKSRAEPIYYKMWDLGGQDVRL